MEVTVINIDHPKNASHQEMFWSIQKMEESAYVLKYYIYRF